MYSYLRRTTYIAASGTWDAARLKAMADQAYACATKEVLITSTGGELGSAQGQQKFDKAILLQAIEALLAEECPESVPPPDSPGVIVNFGCRPVSL